MKTAKSFRLSAQALERLQYLTNQTGANETAIIEIALTLFQQDVKRSFYEPDNLAFEMGVAVPSLAPGPVKKVQKNPKHRKRH